MMIIQVDFGSFQKALKDFKTIVAKSPLASSEDAKDLGGLITADDTTGSITIEVALKGFFMSAVVQGVVKDPGSVVVRVDSITSQKTSIGEATLSCGQGDKVMKLRSGRFKADIPIHYDTDEITGQRPDKLTTTHSVHVNKLSSAIKCVDLDSANKDDPIFAKFVFDSSGFTAWANSPSTAALYRNVKSAFDEPLEVVLPVDFLVAYLSRVTGKIQLAVDDSLFQLTSDEIDISHPLREADVFDIKTAIMDIIEGKDYLSKFTSNISESVECLNSVSGFAPDDARMSVTIDHKKGLFICKTASASGEGENSFTIVDQDDGTSKDMSCFLNCRVVTKLVESIKSLNSEELTWYMLKDRILIQGKDGSANYVCAQMD